jgi:phosphatidylserine/phosphatidylglycerophosphate/cardiolipin synthase-like enzyme
MRKHQTSQGLTVNTIAGTHVVFFGLNIESKLKKDFRGFAIQREDHLNGEIIWMRGSKTFEKTEPHPAIGSTFSTQKHPVQSFQWSDFSVHPDTKYTYTIQCLYNDPAALIPKSEIKVNISTEREFDNVHSVFFNRGSVATQEYARRFQNKDPEVAGQAAFDWLSRGLIEALFNFFGKAKDGYHIYGAIYEFQWETVLETIKKQSKKVHFHILFDDVNDESGPFKHNEKAIDKAGIKKYCKGRKNAKLMHNKFFVLCDKNSNPLMTWTGSTNLTKNGIFGHSNVGHVVDDKNISKAFLDYWKRLNDDPEIDNIYRGQNMTASAIPATLMKGTIPVFSPRGTKLDSLNWYSTIANGAKDGLFMTFAFGMHQLFKDIYSKDDEVLKMALMDKAYSSPKVKTRDENDIRKIRKRPNVVIAIGNRIVTNSFDRWLAELDKIEKSVFVYWVHSKYMLVDPLGPDPIVITGSANFSKASTDTNDENMLVIKGDKRIADIYFGEYMRLYNHYAFREVLGWHKQKQKEDDTKDPWKPQYLIEDDSWMDQYFDSHDTSGRYRRRVYFSGPLSV